ncbi:hypothetical protein ACF1BE_02615 [Streptomyces sp. NPDC014991]|uniref:hypothetical protein n=1 Tax=Streptomyces sp. NPDC014991 TaxID=3364935 RepID=UPI0036F746A6
MLTGPATADHLRDTLGRQAVAVAVAAALPAGADPELRAALTSPPCSVSPSAVSSSVRPR